MIRPTRNGVVAGVVAFATAFVAVWAVDDFWERGLVCVAAGIAQGAIWSGWEAFQKRWESERTATLEMCWDDLVRWSPGQSGAVVRCETCRTHETVKDALLYSQRPCISCGGQRFTVVRLIRKGEVA